MCRRCDQDVCGAEVGSMCRGMKESWFPPTGTMGREIDCSRGKVGVEDLGGESSTDEDHWSVFHVFQLAHAGMLLLLSLDGHADNVE